MKNQLFVFFCIMTSSQCSNATVPVKVSVSSFRKCPSDIRELSVTPNISEAIQTYIEYVNSTCNCRNDPTWTQVGYLDMRDSSQSCPSEWSLTTSNGVRACGRRHTGRGSCNSVFYSTSGIRYSQVCGRIQGYQYYSTDAFSPYITSNIGIDSWYVEGVSLTHGQPGSRTHVWTFANAWYETTHHLQYICPCMLRDPTSWPYSVPSFVGNNYFCATGSRYQPESRLFTDNPLWDGVGCSGDSNCCQFNQPPWFCHTLPVPTTDDLEVRICADESTSSENTFISNIEVYVK